MSDKSSEFFEEVLIDWATDRLSEWLIHWRGGWPRIFFFYFLNGIY